MVNLFIYMNPCPPINSFKNFDSLIIYNLKEKDDTQISHTTKSNLITNMSSQSQ